ncbi:MAG: F0F1 ATP synthase subunit gamma [Candidatus Omnitrophica bacterium]|nr:F0F1 ATP synthase subunit gamma [Candidatus Omnitrophota bacterium]
MKLLSHIKKDMEFNQNLYNLIEVLKEIAITQYRILEKKIRTFDTVFSSLGAIFSILESRNLNHPLLQTSKKQPGVIVVTSDAGLLGGLNMSVMTQAIKEAEVKKARLIIVGEKGQMYAAETTLSYITFKGVKDETRLEQALKLRDYILDEELSGRLGELKIVYPYATSIVAQHIKSLQLFPFSAEEQFQSKTFSAVDPNLILESSLNDILEYWIYLFLGQKFYQIFGLSRLAELSARFNHLEISKSKIEQLNKELKLQYFRQRHELIDRNMRELFAARLAFK